METSWTFVSNNLIGQVDLAINLYSRARDYRHIYSRAYAILHVCHSDSLAYTYRYGISQAGSKRVVFKNIQGFS